MDLFSQVYNLIILYEKYMKEVDKSNIATYRVLYNV